jgi:membrane-bound inhibitor of C-type lysozyme
LEYQLGQAAVKNASAHSVVKCKALLRAGLNRTGNGRHGHSDKIARAYGENHIVRCATRCIDRFDDNVNRVAGVSLVIACLFTGCAVEPPHDVARTIEYACDGGETIEATYLTHGRQGAEFVVLSWKGREYGLARALSASGARYAALYDPAMSSPGVQWWEAKGEATLGAFTGKDFFETRPLVTGCRAKR